MLDSYGGVDVRRGTECYQFDGSECIQPELNDMARFVLSWFGGGAGETSTLPGLPSTTPAPTPATAATCSITAAASAAATTAGAARRSRSSADGRPA